MRWGYWMQLYLRTHCVARGLSPLSIAAYEATLRQFRAWNEGRAADSSPDRVSAREVLEYLEYLRGERDNGAAAVNRTVTILRSFYRAIVAMGHLEPANNPLAGFPSIKAAPRKLPVVLDGEEVGACSPLRRRHCCSACVIGRCWLCFTAPASGRASAQVFARGSQSACPHCYRAGQRRPRAYGPLQRGSCRTASRVRPGARTRAAFGAILPLALWQTIVAVLSMSGSHACSPRPARQADESASAAAYLRLAPRARRCRARHDSRSARSSADHEHPDLSARDGADLRAAAERHPIARLLSTIEHLLPHVRLPFQRPGARCATA